MVWKSHLCRVLMRPRAGPPLLLLPGSRPTKFYSVSSFDLPATGNLTKIINNFKLAKFTLSPFTQISNRFVLVHCIWSSRIQILDRSTRWNKTTPLLISWSSYMVKMVHFWLTGIPCFLNYKVTQVNQLFQVKHVSQMYQVNWASQVNQVSQMK